LERNCTHSIPDRPIAYLFDLCCGVEGRAYFTDKLCL